MMLDNQVWAIFSFEFKMNHKAAETTQNINKEFLMLKERNFKNLYFLKESVLIKGHFTIRSLKINQKP